MQVLQVVWVPSSPSKCAGIEVQLEQEEQVLEARMGGKEDGISTHPERSFRHGARQMARLMRNQIAFGSVWI